MRNPTLRIAIPSIAALAVALAAGPAASQAFQGTPTVQSGNVAFARTTPGTETITVGTAQSVVNWAVTAAPDGAGNIDYLPQTTSATFVNGAGAGNYTILNRILPSNAANRVAFNGQVTSTLDGARGGNVWFYSPGGIIVGDTGRFDVGSLLLTTLDPVRDQAGSFINGTGQTVFSPATPGSIVNILSGAQINAAIGSVATGNIGRYVAMVAPVVYQAGTVTVDGSAAYVAAEAVTLTIGQGLFDIVVTTGSTDNGFPLQHAGTTTGPASSAALGDIQRIYLVSVPKNDAITLAIAPTARLGFTPATAAAVENGRIVLSAGSNVRGGLGMAFDQASPLAASIRIDGGTFTSSVDGQATLNAIAASNIATPTFARDLTLVAGNALVEGVSAVQVAARVAGQTLSVGGNLFLQATRSDAVTLAGAGGVASVVAENDGTVRVAGNVRLDAAGRAGASGTNGAYTAGGIATGGNAQIIARSGGLVDVTGLTRVGAEAQALAGNGRVRGGTASISALNTGRIVLRGTASVTAGASQTSNVLNDVTVIGGQATVNADAGGQITITGALSADSVATGGFSTVAGRGGAAATGGSSAVSATGDGSVVALNGGVTLDSAALRAGANSNGAGGGAGRGGTVGVSQSATGRVAITGDATLLADAVGGNGSGAGIAAGSGTGGDARFVSNVGLVSATGAVTISAGGTGGTHSAGGPGGTGTGGIANIGAGTGGTTIDGAATLTATGIGGASVNGGGTGGVGQGGSALVGTVGGGGITIGGALGVAALGIGGQKTGTGAGGAAGAGRGGVAQVFANPAASGGAGGTITLAGVTLDADGRHGLNASTAGADGEATGGVASFVTAGGTLTATFVNLTANGSDRFVTSTAGTVAANGSGGTVNVSATNGGALTVTNQVQATAVGIGTDSLTAGGTGGTGGTGTGGAIAFVADTGSTVRAGSLSSVADAFGGRATAGGTGGQAIAGTANLSAGANSRFLISGGVGLQAEGSGGGVAGPGGGTGGTGAGGVSRLQAAATGLVEVGGETFLYAAGNGGDAFGIGTGGVGRGGLAILRTDGGAINLRGEAGLYADGSGGSGPIGGAGFGGSNDAFTQGAYLNAVGGAITVAGPLELDAGGTGGDGAGGIGGTGTGGTANITAQTNTASPGGSAITLAAVVIEAAGEGGAGGVGSGGGDGFGGSALTAAAAGNGVLTGTELVIDVSGRGGEGGTGGAGGIGRGGFSQTGTLSSTALPTNIGRTAFDSVTALASGIGGVAGASIDGAAATAGGSGFGGAASITARGSLVEIRDARLFANGVGGAGGIVGGVVTGPGGRGAGGDATVLVTPHFTSRAAATGRFGTILQSVDAVNGAGAAGAVSAFGTAGIVVEGSTATIGTLTASAAGGTQRIDTAFAASNAPGNVAGQVEVVTFGDRVSGIQVLNGSLAVAADATVFSGGDVSLVADNGNVSIGSGLQVVAGNIVSGQQALTPLPDNPAPGARNGFLPETPFAVPANPSIIRAGRIAITASGTITQPTGLAAATDFAVTGQNAAFGRLTSGTDLSIVTASLSTGDVDATGDVELTATGGNLVTGNVRAGGDADLTAAGAIAAGIVSAGDTATVIAEGDVALAGASAGIDNPAAAGEGTRYAVAIQAGGNVAVAGAVETAGDVGIIAQRGAISTRDISGDGSIVLLSDRDISTGGLEGGTDGGSSIIFLGGTGNLATLGEGFNPTRLLDRSATAFGVGNYLVGGAVETGNFDVATSGDVTALGAIDADRRIVIEAGGLARFEGIASADRVRVVSADIAIGGAGGLGSPAAGLVEVVALSGAGTATFGGAAQDASGYRLDAGEIASLRANRISFSVASNGAGAGDLTLAGFDVAGSTGGQAGLYGEGAQLAIDAPGAIRVTGVVRLIEAGTDDLLSIATPGRIEVVTDSGSLGVFPSETADGAVGGRIALSGSTVAVAAQDVLTRLTGDDGTAAGRAALVNAAAPAVRPEGFLQAGAITLTASNGVFIQNSGTSATAAGFTVGAGGLAIVSTAPAASPGLEAVVNGRQTIDGGFRVNGDTRQAVTVRTAENAAGAAPATSGVNGCLFSATSCAPVVTPPVVVPPEEPGTIDPDPEPGVPLPAAEAPGDIAAAIQGVIDGPLSAAAEATNPTSVPDVRIQALVDTSGFDTISFIEEPVTGGGNAALFGADDSFGLSGIVRVEPAADEGVTGTGAGQPDEPRPDDRGKEKKR